MARNPVRKCPECGECFEATHPRKLFCKPAHGVAFNNRQLARGQSIMGLAMAWRVARHRKDPATREAARVAYREFCRALDRYNAEDREAGRADPMRIYKARTAAGLLDD